jgi:ATP-dependent DNA ligase
MAHTEPILAVQLWLKSRLLKYVMLVRYFYFRAYSSERLFTGLLDTYGSGYSLRFPRFTRFRPDKSWKDCMTYQGEQSFVSL